MPRKALDMRKTCGRLFAKGKKKAPQGRDTWRIAINTARLRGSCQEHRGINSRRHCINISISNFIVAGCVLCGIL